MTVPLVALRDAPMLFPEGAQPCSHSIWRYTKNGIGGVKLRAVLVRGALHTSQTWVDEFIAAVNERRANDA